MSIDYHQLALFALAFAMMVASPGPFAAAAATVKARCFLSNITAKRRVNRATGGVMVGAGVAIVMT